MQSQPSAPTAATTATTEPLSDAENPSDGLPPETDGDHASQETLAERFARLCSDASDNTAPSSAHPILPGLPDEQALYLARNAAGELYMTPKAVSAAEGSDRPAVLAAFRAALADAYGDDDVEGTVPTALHPDESDPANNDLAHLDSNQSFCALDGLPEFDPPDIASFSWEGSYSQRAIDDFFSTWRAEREAREREDAADAAAAMARAAASGAGRSRSQSRPPRPVTKRRYSFNADPILWAAQEEAAASAVLKELRTNLGKLRKGSSKAPHESSAVWALLKDGKGKLKPEAAAEMARAKFAAAAAAAAMREDQPETLPQDSMQDLKTDNNSYLDKGHSHLLYEHLELNRRAHSNKFEGQPFNLVYSKSPGFPRALSLDSGTRLNNVGKQKRVEFAAGTVFAKK